MGSRSIEQNHVLSAGLSNDHGRLYTIQTCLTSQRNTLIAS